jgi:hypothetical protein
MNNHIITAERVRPKKPYTPQFSTPAAIAVRRLAWAMDRNMYTQPSRQAKVPLLI